MAASTLMNAGSVLIQCPACPTAVSVPVNCYTVNMGRAHEGEARLVCEPDTADLWAHMWTHEDDDPQ